MEFVNIQGALAYARAQIEQAELIGAAADVSDQITAASAGAEQLVAQVRQLLAAAGEELGYCALLLAGE